MAAGAVGSSRRCPSDSWRSRDPEVAAAAAAGVAVVGAAVAVDAWRR